MSRLDSQPAESSPTPGDKPVPAVHLQPRRRWYQFRLRTLMVMMLLVSLPLAGLAWRFHRARRQAAAVATIRELGGNVIYDDEFHFDAAGNQVPAHPLAHVPSWLKRAMGIDFFHSTVCVLDSYGQPDSESDAIRFWQAVEILPRLQMIHADGTWVQPNAAAAALGDKTELKYLALRSPGLGDNHLQFLGGLRQLYGLDLSGSRITDHGIQCLVGLPDLRIADLRGTHISRQGIDIFERAYPGCTVAHD